MTTETTESAIVTGETATAHGVKAAATVTGIVPSCAETETAVTRSGGTVIVHDEKATAEMATGHAVRVTGEMMMGRGERAIVIDRFTEVHKRTVHGLDSKETDLDRATSDRTASYWNWSRNCVKKSSNFATRSAR